MGGTSARGMTHDPRNAVVLLSGGLDSMVVAGIARERGFAVHALTIDYNQRHRRELDCAATIARAIGTDPVDAGPLRMSRHLEAVAGFEVALTARGFADAVATRVSPA